VGACPTLPAPSFFSTALMTPTATVWRMSRTAKRPSGGYTVNGSTHMGLVGTCAQRAPRSVSPQCVSVGPVLHALHHFRIKQLPRSLILLGVLLWFT